MKKILNNRSFASYQKVTGRYFTDSWQTDGYVNMDMRYDIGEDKVYVYIPYYAYTADVIAYEFDKNDRQKTIAILDKYLEWNQKAIEMGVTLDKSIEDINLVGWYQLDDVWNRSCKKTCLIRTRFSSSGTKTHFLKLSFGEILSCDNKYFKPDKFQMFHSEVVNFRTALTEEKLQSAIKEIENKKLIEDAFK